MFQPKLVLKPRLSAKNNQKHEKELEEWKLKVEALEREKEELVEENFKLSENLVDYQILLRDTFQTLEEVSLKYTIQSSDNNFLVNSVKELQALINNNNKCEIDASANFVHNDLSSESKDQDEQCEKLEQKHCVCESSKVGDENEMSKLQIEIKALEERLSIETNFRKIEIQENTRFINTLMDQNDNLLKKISDHEKVSKEKVSRVNASTMTDENVDFYTKYTEQLENIRQKSIELKDLYDESQQEKRDMKKELTTLKEKYKEDMKERMVAYHVLVREKMELIRKLDENKLLTYDKVNVDFTELLKNAKNNYADNIKAMMHEMHKLLVENKLLKTTSEDKGFLTWVEKECDHMNTNIEEIKTTLFTELNRVKSAYDKDHNEILEKYEAVLKERNASAGSVKTYEKQLKENKQIISDLQEKLGTALEKSYTYQADLSNALEANIFFQQQISDLNGKLQLLESGIATIKGAEDSKLNMERKMLQDATLAATIIQGKLAEKHDIMIKVTREFNVLKQRYSRSLYNGRILQNRLDEEIEKSHNLRKAVSILENRLNEEKQQNNKLQMQMDALELCLQNQDLPKRCFEDMSHGDEGWGTPRAASTPK